MSISNSQTIGMFAQKYKQQSIIRNSGSITGFDRSFGICSSEKLWIDPIDIVEPRSKSLNLSVPYQYHSAII